jgi:hypothetical protein
MSDIQAKHPCRNTRIYQISCVSAVTRFNDILLSMQETD